MPVTPTYPGVHIEEIPSGVRTITGVATSITALVGRALRGPVDAPVTINNFGDFERIFGGLWKESHLGFAVRDFYLNGGAQAIVVRLYRADSGPPPKPGTAPITVDGLTFESAYEGSWGKNLRVAIDVDVAREVATSMGLEPNDLFNLTVRDTAPGGVSERLTNLSVKESPRRVDRVLVATSKLLKWKGDWPSSAPVIPLIGDAHTKAEALRDAESEDPPVQAKIDAARASLEEALQALRDGVSTAETALEVAEQQLANALAADPPVQADIDAAHQAVDDAETALEESLQDMDASDGLALDDDDFVGTDKEADKEGLFALEKADSFNLLCLPPYNGVANVGYQTVIPVAAAYCEKRRAFLLVDSPSQWTDKDKAKAGITAGVGTTSKNSAIFFPRLRQPNPLKDNLVEDFASCGAVAGVFARTDGQRGVWKAPAGLAATLNGVPQLTVPLTDEENGELNPLGVNCLRSRPPAGRVIWGSRTLQGDDRLASEWKYVPVRRLALFIEESLYRGTKWAVFEPNDEPLWAQLRLNIGAFMQNLFRQSAFQGQSPKDAYFVKADNETTTQNDINLGIVNIVVGFAPLKPAEFVIIKIQQMAGQIDT